MATPPYEGQQQSAMTSASWLGSWLDNTPTYAGATPIAPKASMFGGAVPAYVAAPINVVAPDAVTGDVENDLESNVCVPTTFAIVVPRQ